MLVLGVGAFLFPFVSSMAAGIFVGALMLTGSVLRLVHLQPKTGSKEWWLDGIGSMLGLAAAGLILLFPVTGAVTLTLLVGAYFLTQGLLRFAAAWSIPGHRTWFIASGLLDVILAFIVISGWPDTGLWVLGVLFGAHLTMMGLIMLLTPREVLEAPPNPVDPRPGSQPRDEASDDQRIDAALAESFPASDPPGFGPR